MSASPLIVILTLLTILVAGLDAAAEPGRHARGDLRQRLIERFDADKDGKLSDSERAAARAAFQEHRGTAFDRLDANHDGALSREEFLAQLSVGGARRRLAPPTNAPSALPP